MRTTTGGAAANLSTEDLLQSHFPAFTAAFLHLVRPKSDLTYYGSTPSL